MFMIANDENNPLLEANLRAMTTWQTRTGHLMLSFEHCNEKYRIHGVFGPFGLAFGNLQPLKIVHL